MYLFRGVGRPADVELHRVPVAVCYTRTAASRVQNMVTVGECPDLVADFPG